MVNQLGLRKLMSYHLYISGGLVSRLFLLRMSLVLSLLSTYGPHQVS